MFMRGQVESVSVVRLPHRLKPLRHSLRVAVLTPRADLRATGYRIPRGTGPFNS